MEKDINTVDEKIEDEIEEKEVEETLDDSKPTDVESTPVDEKEEESLNQGENEDTPVETKEESTDDTALGENHLEAVETDNHIEVKEKKKKEPKTTKEKVFFGFKIAGNVLFYLVIILLFMISIMNINASNNDGMPSIFGRGYLSVQSHSMENPVVYPNCYLETSNTTARKGVDYYKFELITDKVAGDPTPEDTYTTKYGQYFIYNSDSLGSGTYYHRVKSDIKKGAKITEKLYTTYKDEYNSYSIKNFNKGDMVVDETLSNKEKKNLKVGDVITFYDETLAPGQEEGLNSHRIVYIDEDGTYYLMGDKILGSTLRSVGRFSKADDSDASWYTAASDAGAGGSFESNPNVDILRLTSDDLSLIKGRVIDVWSGFGSTYDNITNNMALYFLVFVFPVVLLFIISMIFVILNIRKLVISKKHPEANEKVMTEDEMKLSLEAERERMRQEILAELKKEQEQQANADNKEDKEEK